MLLYNDFCVGSHEIFCPSLYVLILTAISYYSSPDQTLTNPPHMASCIETCYPDVCVCIQLLTVEGGAAEHSALCLSMFPHNPNSPSPLKVAPSPSSAVVISPSGAGRGPRDGLWPVSVSSDRLIGAIPICVQVCVCVYSEPDTSLSGSLEWRRDEGGDEKSVEEDEQLALCQSRYVKLIQG